MKALLTREEVAEVLKVSTRTVSTLTARGQLRFTRIGRQVRYTEDAVHEYIDAQETQKAPPREKTIKHDSRFHYYPGMKVVSA